MPHTGNTDTQQPGPYPPSSMGGHGATMDIGDVLWAGVSGQIAHFDHDLNYKQHIVTRHAIDPNPPFEREIEVTDACWDSQGRLYVCLYSPVWWGDPPPPPGFGVGGPTFPQIQWFENNANDKGRFDQGVFFAVPGASFAALLPYGICCLADDTLVVLAVETIDDPNSPETVVLVHLSQTGAEIERWVPDQDYGLSGPNDQSLEVGPDGYTVYYCDSEYVRRFDTRAGLNVAPIFAPDAVDGLGVVVLPDGGVITQVFPGNDDGFRRYTQAGAIVWEKLFNGALEPGSPQEGVNVQALGMDQNSFYSYFTGPTAIVDPVTSDPGGSHDRIVHLSLLDGEILDWAVSPAIPYDEEFSTMTVSRVRVTPLADSWVSVIG